MKKFLCFLFVILIVYACATESQLEKEIGNIPVEIEIKRFDKEFSEASPSDLPKLKREYPYLFPEQFPDSVWVAKMNDTLQIELFDEISKQYPDFESDTSEIRSLFQHIKYYFENFEAPKVVTVISDVDYKNRVIYADTLLLLGLDNYLGKEHRFYGGIQQYIKNDFEKEQIEVDIAKTIATSKIRSPRNRTFLAQMVYYGKLYYITQLFIPFRESNQIIGYTEEEYNWAKANENYIWRYFIERELLFSTDRKLSERFIDPAPFSKFYLELDNESPGRLGRFIGWEIVRSYMENNEVSLQQMLNTSAEEIFNNSKYKPEK
ncbi:gliding motility lipoprotein GldB [Galbibacter mesophilus]|uniref:gliding motility lipoprotein GldB n=1 Tax=Galbibacter mesophilus TaxID=379069 RepID=UPI00191FEDEE|nr:gliding motility lipoprotein GldB [Galbibacter mesophilus]MCM5661486.1 gliding motility lipoprotein GldB [Galbibacter mesophilus]